MAFPIKTFDLPINKYIYIYMATFTHFFQFFFFKKNLNLPYIRIINLFNFLFQILFLAEYIYIQYVSLLVMYNVYLFFFLMNRINNLTIKTQLLLTFISKFWVFISIILYNWIVIFSIYIYIFIYLFIG